MRIAHVVGEFFSCGGLWSAAEQLCHNTRTAMKRISEREKTASERNKTKRQCTKNSA